MATAHETDKSPAELEARVWELVEKLRFCMFSSWDGEKQHQRPLTAMSDKETGAIHFLVDAAGLIVKAVVTGASSSKAVSFLFSPQFVDSVLRERELADLFVHLRGEFVVDGDGRAVDAEFTRAQLPTGDRPAGSDYGIQGGLFESWFQPVRDN